MDLEADSLAEPHQPKVSPPITLLQEICSRNGLTPDYQLLSTEGSVHEPTFKIAVTVADISAIASGQSKKKARHAAAREAIEKLRKKPDLNFDGINFDTMTPMDEPSTKSSYEIAINEANPVGKLQEICMKMRCNPPDYETCDEKGLAHERIFSLSCTIASLDLTTWGQGKSKKIAKRRAAESMLSKLESSGVYEKTAPNGKKQESGAATADDSLYLDVDDNSHFVVTRQLTSELIKNIGSKVSDIWDDIQAIEEDERPGAFYDVFKTTLGSFAHMRIDYLTPSDCILHVCDQHENSLLTSFGSGQSNVEAIRNAILNAYKQMMVLIDPLTKKDRLLPHRAEENHYLLGHPFLEARDT